ncbi:beta-1 [Colletotrichum tabaci]|uniref:Beta-1 n=1 Tax=Colletotrichum tabaci TaxID=1209068 RepID=A0AAV9T3W2_9PEZI
MKLLASLLAVAGTVAPLCAAAVLPQARQTSWPNGPFTTNGRWQQDASGNNVNFAGTNWPGHGEVMVPEGLQYNSVEEVVSKIKSLGMNAIRLTFAIELVDQIYANGGEDVDLRTAFVEGLGEANGTAVLARVLERNPSFTEATTRLQVYDAIAAECARQEIYILLDNHMSKGKWCCSGNDGNTWWGDREFDAANWVRGLAYMAEHGKSWPALVAMSLRNELRQATDNPELVAASYHWQDWYKYIQQGTDAVNGANPDVLIYLSGLNYDTTVAPVFRGTALTPGNATFSRADFDGYADKLVLEIHNYEGSIGSCASLRYNLYNRGFQAMNATDPATADVFPVALTEFGFNMNDATYQGVYSTCLAEYLPEARASFFIWVLVGSYYTRQGTQNFDESWGLLNVDWSAWRNPAYVEEQLKPMVAGVIG